MAALGFPGTSSSARKTRPNRGCWWSSENITDEVLTTPILSGAPEVDIATLLPRAIAMSSRTEAADFTAAYWPGEGQSCATFAPGECVQMITRRSESG